MVWIIGRLNPTTKKLKFTLKMMKFNVHTSETIQINTEDPNLNISKSDYPSGSSKDSLSGGTFTGSFDVKVFEGRKQIILDMTEFTPWYRDKFHHILHVIGYDTDGLVKTVDGQESELENGSLTNLSEYKKQKIRLDTHVIGYYTDGLTKTVDGQEEELENGTLGQVSENKFSGRRAHR